MAGVKRAAKLLMKGGGDLEAGILDLKTLQDIISGKLIPMINNVSTTLLKWSYTESNYTFPNVFSAWADLDAAFTQLLQEYLQECSKYRQCFKTIIAEAKTVSEVQKEKERTGNKVAATISKLENAKRSAKKNESNERTKTLVVNLEADVRTAIKKDAEAEELLKNTLADFEFYKAFHLRDTLIAHCQALKILLQKGLEICNVKLETAESMPAAPAMTPEGFTDNDAKVEEVFSKFSLQLPPRDPTIERNLPVQRFKSLPPPSQSMFASKSPLATQKAFEPLRNKPLRIISGLSDDEDSDDYTVPDEKAIAQSPKEERPPQLPPRNISFIDEEDYVIPNIKQKSETKTDSQPPVQSSTDSVYFQVDSGDDEPRNPSSTVSEVPQINLPPSDQDQGIMEPVYSIPPDADDDDLNDSNDYNQHYGNVTTENLQNNQRHSFVPERPPPYAKPRKPAVCPKPPKKPPKEAPPRGTQDSMRRTGSEEGSDNDMYSTCHEDENDNKTPPSPVALPSRHAFNDVQRPGHDAPTTSSNTKTTACHIEHSYGSMLEPTPSRTTPDSDDPSIVQTYFASSITVSETPTVAKKPPVSTRKPPVPTRGNFKH